MPRVPLMLLHERHPSIYFHSDTAYLSCGRERQRLLCSGNLVTIRIYFLDGKGLAEDNEEQGYCAAAHSCVEERLHKCSPLDNASLWATLTRNKGLCCVTNNFLSSDTLKKILTQRCSELLENTKV